MRGKLRFNYSLYPNPAGSNINLKITTDKDENISITIYNSLGDIILNKELSLVSGKNLQKFDLQKTTIGVYYMKLQCSNKISYIKFVKTE